MPYSSVHPNPRFQNVARLGRAVLRELARPSRGAAGSGPRRNFIRRTIILALTMPFGFAFVSWLLLLPLESYWTTSLGSVQFLAARADAEGSRIASLTGPKRFLRLYVNEPQHSITVEYGCTVALSGAGEPHFRVKRGFGFESRPYTDLAGTMWIRPWARTAASDLRIPWSYRVWFPTWAAFSAAGLCLILPTIAFWCGPLRRARRRIAGRCTDCAYNLTGLPEPRCPECGTRASAESDRVGPNRPSPSREPPSPEAGG